MEGVLANPSLDRLEPCLASGNGNNVLIGIDPIIGISNSLMIPSGLREYLEDLDIVTLSQARNTLLGSHK